MYQLALGLRGFEVLSACNGLEALTLVEQYPPDLVVLDLGLPIIDGFSVQQEMAAHETTRPVPIVVVTGLDVAPETLPVPCVLRKPVTPDEIVSTVFQYLSDSGPR